MSVTYVGSRIPQIYGHGDDEFDPSTISGLQVWLKADAIEGLSDGQAVTTWEDSSGQNHDATHSNSPVLKTNIINGLPVVRYNGTSQYHDLGDLSASFASAATLFVVAVINDTEYSLYRTADNDGYWRYSGDGNGYMRAFRSARVDTYPSTMPSTGTHYFALVSSASTYQMYVDGVAQSAQAAAYAAGNSHVIGYNSGPGYFAGDVAEVLVYDSALSAGDIEDVHGYLTDKYAL